MADDLDSAGFISVACTACDNPSVWLTCNECGKSDHFHLDDSEVRCRCGATYAFASCVCGARVERDGMSFVEWKNGPMQLADAEWAWGRVAALAVGTVVILVVALAGFWYLLT